jgi:hypothetical protein
MEKAMMKQGIVCVLAMVSLLPAALGKKEKKVDPKLKGIHTIFVEGKDDARVRDARESLEIGRCFQVAPTAESADAVLSILWSSQTQAVLSPGLGVGGQMPMTDTGKTYRSTVTVKTHEGSKLKKVWSDSIDLTDPEETRKSGVRRLIEKLSEEVCGTP